MWKKTKQFFKLVGYETKRITRNKIVFTMLLVFSLALVGVIAFVQSDSIRYPIAIYTDGVNIEEIEVFKIIEEEMQLGEITYVDSVEEGLALIKKNSVCVFVCLNAGEGQDNVTAIIYYGESNTIGRELRSSLANQQNKYAYEKLTTFLSKFGIELNPSYFEIISFSNDNKNSITLTQLPFSIEVACFVSIILMLGLAYSLSRDHETNVSKNIAYIPVGTNRYLFSKIVPYFILGILEISLMCLLGNLAFKIEFEINVLLIILLSLLFVLSVIMLGLLCSLLKSQISTIFLAMMTILLPTFIAIMVYVPACPIYTQIFLNILPIIPFVNFLNCMVFNGVILWWYIPIFVAQIIAYYLITIAIMKKRAQG